MTLLITGIHGFVGSNLVAALKGKHRIYRLDIVAPEKEGVVHTYAWEEMDDLPEIDALSGSFAFGSTSGYARCVPHGT